MDKLNLFFKSIVVNDAISIIDSMDISASSRDEYKQRIKYFLQFIQINGLTNNSLLLYKRELENRIDLGVAAKNKYLITAKTYLKELHRNDTIPIDITGNVKLFKQYKGHKKFGHSEEDVQKIINELRLYNLRDKSILYLLIFQGLRQIEITRLSIQDIDFLREIIFVQGKGKDDKEVINLHPETTKVLKAYIDKIKKKEGQLYGVTTRTIRNIHNRIVKKLGINSSTHGTRHYFTTKILKAFDGDVMTSQKFTRHSSLEMLNVYNDDINMEKKLPTYVEAFNNLK